jgi:hypothetical protein
MSHVVFLGSCHTDDDTVDAFKFVASVVWALLWVGVYHHNKIVSKQDQSTPLTFLHYHHRVEQ